MPNYRSSPILRAAYERAESARAVCRFLRRIDIHGLQGLSVARRAALRREENAKVRGLDWQAHRALWGFPPGEQL